MAFFDRLGETIVSKSKDVAQKTKDFAEVSNLNSQIRSQEDLIRNAYMEIGQLYYAANRSNPNGLYGEQIRAILAAEAEIEIRRQKIREIKGVKTCEQCGADIPLGATFCANCGAKVEVVPVQPAADTQPAAIHCPECGAELPADAAFCTSCGFKIK